jgi:hypothetical protein
MRVQNPNDSERVFGDLLNQLIEDKQPVGQPLEPNTSCQSFRSTRKHGS